MNPHIHIRPPSDRAGQYGHILQWVHGRRHRVCPLAVAPFDHGARSAPAHIHAGNLAIDGLR